MGEGEGGQIENANASDFNKEMSATTEASCARPPSVLDLDQARNNTVMGDKGRTGCILNIKLTGHPLLSYGVTILCQLSRTFS